MGALFIFVAKIVEVSLMTLRLVFVSRGEKWVAVCVGFVEVMIWFKLFTMVIGSIGDNPTNLVAYALGFSAGSYVGMILEEKIALGYTTVQVIVSEENGCKLANFLRAEGKAVTVLEGEGRDSKKSVLLTHVKRKNINPVIKSIESQEMGAVVSITETKKIYGGFGIRK